MKIDKVRKATVKIRCCETYEANLDINTKEIGIDISIGTGFFIDRDKVVTATHVIRGYFDWKYNIYIEANNLGIIKPIKAIPLDKEDKLSPIIILQLEEEINVEGLRFTSNYNIKTDDEWETFGYPKVKWNKGHRQDGDVSHKLNNSDKYNSNYDLNYTDRKVNNFSGLSGAPFIVNEMLLGIMMEQSIDGRQAVSLGALTVEEFLNYIPKDYLIKDKHKEKARKTVREFTEKQILKNKESGKYIPKIFTSINELDEFMRYFTDPILFFEKLIEDISTFKFRNIKYYLNTCELNEIELFDAKDLLGNVNLNNIDVKVHELQSKLTAKIFELLKFNISQLYTKEYLFGNIVDEKKLVALENAIKAKYYSFLENIDKKHRRRFNSLKEDLEFIFKEIMETDIKKFITSLYFIKFKVLLLTEKAGQGKTNFLCNLTENNLIKKNMNCIYVNAMDIDSNCIEESLSLLILNTHDTYKFKELLSHLDEISDHEDKLFFIIIDGLNENSDIKKLSKNIIWLIKDLLKYKNLKIILTCREEYFTERFSNLKVELAQNLIHLNKFNHSMNSLERKRLFNNYLKYFNINLAKKSSYVYNKLTSELLLFRYFCEAYRNQKLQPMCDIYNFEIFSLYLENKFKEITRKEELDSKTYSSEIYKEFINEITEYMIEHKQFNNIPKIIFDRKSQKMSSNIIEEDIIFREDIYIKKGLIDERESVINFTFDEFRDYLLAKKLLENYSEEESAGYKSLIEELTDDKYTVAEGISKYLFYASKKYNNDKFNAIIQSQKWYKRVYFNNILSIHDDYVYEQDIINIKDFLINNLFVEESKHLYGDLCYGLICRYDAVICKNLNVKLLINIIDALLQKKEVKSVTYILNTIKEYCRWNSGIDCYSFRSEKTCKWKETTLVDILDEVLKSYLHRDIKYRYLLWVSMGYFTRTNESTMFLLEKYFVNFNVQFMRDLQEFVGKDDDMIKDMMEFQRYLYKRKRKYAKELQEKVDIIKEEFN